AEYPGGWDQRARRTNENPVGHGRDAHAETAVAGVTLEPRHEQRVEDGAHHHAEELCAGPCSLPAGSRQRGPHDHAEVAGEHEERENLQVGLGRTERYLAEDADADLGVKRTAEGH